jgi:hypothetical protein
MMVMTESGRVYAKYPPGYPLLGAVAFLMGGSGAVYWVNPICTVIACACSFFLFREMLGDFASVLAVLWLSWNPLVLTYANDANSHASTLLCIVVGMWGTIRWLKHDKLWNGVLGGVCLGYAATIRYSEGLLVVPVLFAVGVRMLAARPVARSRVKRSMTVLLAWAVPVALLACFCWCAFGAPWRTGYAYCGEESGFGWKYVLGDAAQKRPGNWETLLVQMNWMGLFMLWPVGMVGLIAMVGERWREGGFIALWVVPLIALYLGYYWAPAGETSLGYLRFFVPVVPAFILSALWLMERGVRSARRGGVVAMGVVTALGVSVNLWNTLPSLEASLAGRQALAQAAGFLRSRVPRGSSVFLADEGLSNCLDAAGGYNLYNLGLFENSSFTNFDRIMDDPATADEPDPRQRSRMALYWHLLGAQSRGGDLIPKSNGELKEAQDELLTEIGHSGARVFVLLKTGQNRDLLPEDSKWRSNLLGSEVFYPGVQIAARPVGGPIQAGKGGGGGARSLGAVTWTLYEVLPQGP